MNPTCDSAATFAPHYGATAPSQTQSQPPKSNIGWAVAAVVFFWPLAFAAFNHASSVYPLWAAGDYAGAQHAADRTKRLGMISLAVWAVLCVLVAITYVALIGWAISSAADIPAPTYTPYTVPTTARVR